MKYPVYDLVPTGPIINGYLREGNPYHLTPREMQIIQALNRTHFEPELEKILSMFDFVISEDYVGTSFAWGMGAGVDKDFLATVNFHLKKPDLAILFEGKRFTDGVEKGHKHETNDDLTEKVRQFHLGLAKDHDWKVINANRPEEVITDEIVQLITSLD